MVLPCENDFEYGAFVKLLKTTYEEKDQSVLYVKIQPKVNRIIPEPLRMNKCKGLLS